VASATVTQSFTPSNWSALPKRPAVDHEAPEIVPALPLPETSATVGPCPSLKPHAATRPPMVVVDVDVVGVAVDEVLELVELLVVGCAVDDVVLDDVVLDDVDELVAGTVVVVTVACDVELVVEDVLVLDEVEDVLLLDADVDDAEELVDVELVDVVVVGPPPGTSVM